MKHEKNLNCLLGALVALLLSYGMAGSLLTAFDLNMDSAVRLFWVCALVSAVSALCFRYHWGGMVLLCLLVPVSWIIFRQEQTIPQTFYMLYRILRRFHAAYGWGIPSFLLLYQNARSAIYPMGILGAVAAMAVCRAVCRGRGLGIAIAAAAVPFCLCFVVTDTVPDTMYLFLWMLGLGALVLPNSVRQADMAQGNTLTVMTVVPAALALGILFFLVPRDTYDKQPKQLQEKIVNWVQEIPQVLDEVSEDVSSALSGTVQPSEVNLRTLGPRPRNNFPVMEVTASREGVLYLRGQDYDLYDGIGWTATRHRMEALSDEGMENVGEVSVRTRRTRDVLYLPYYPGSGITLTGGQLDNSENLKEYSFYQWKLPEDWRSRTDRVVSSEAQSLEKYVQQIPDEKEQQRYRTLPNDTQQWAKEKLADILDGRQNTADKADAIARYVRNSAPYDRNTQRMPSEYKDFARWFLEEGETGYCVHFATTAVVLLRAAGIEARYVEGYMVSVGADLRETVTEEQAHAWAEYYEPSVGAWVVLEATPADLTQEETRPALEQGQPTRQPLERDPQIETSQPPATTEPELVIPGPMDTGNDPNLSGLWKVLCTILAVLLTIAAVVGQRYLRLWLRRDRQRRGSTNDRALARWREITMLTRLLREEPPEEMEALARKAKYSQHRIGTDELAKMDKEISLARQRMRKKHFLQKLLYCYVFAAY